MWLVKTVAAKSSIAEIHRFLVFGGIVIMFLIFFGLGIMLYIQNLVRKKHEFSEREKIRAVEGNLAKSQFLFNMSHDIRTPMNAICGFSQILCNSQVRNMLSEEEISEYGVIIQSNTDLLSTLVDDILDISDMESGKYRLNIGVCNVNDVCRKAISTVKFRCPDKVNMYMTTVMGEEPVRPDLVDFDDSKSW